MAFGVALLSACGSAIPEPVAPIAITGDTILGAFDLAQTAHPAALPYALDMYAAGEKCRIAVWMLEGEEVHGVHLDVERGTVGYDETTPIAEGARAGVPALVTAIGSRASPLRVGAAWMLAAYDHGELRTVELEMHGPALVLEAVLGDAPEESIQVHDPDDGRFLMTEAGEPPPAVDPAGT